MSLPGQPRSAIPAKSPVRCPLCPSLVLPGSMAGHLRNAHARQQRLDPVALEALAAQGVTLVYCDHPQCGQAFTPQGIATHKTTTHDNVPRSKPRRTRSVPSQQPAGAPPPHWPARAAPVRVVDRVERANIEVRPIPTPRQIALHGSLLDAPPRATADLWMIALRTALINYQASPPDVRQTAGAAILRLPAAGLRRSPRGGPSGQRELRNRLRALPAILEGKAAPLPDLPDEGPPPIRPGEEDPVIRHIKSQIRRASHLLRKGRLARAAMTLKNVQLADVADPAVIAKLESLHPQRDEALPALPADAPRWHPVPDDMELKTQVKRWLHTGGSPGPSGLSEGMLLPAVNDQAAYAGLLALLADIVNGDVGAELTQLLLSSRLIALSKRAAPGAPPGIRPIAVGEILVRLAGRVAFSLIRSQADDFFGHVQLGCGAPGGAQLAALVLQLAAHARNSAVVALDIINAYNTMSRRTILERLFSHAEFASVFRMSHWLLSSKSPLLVIKDNALITQLASSTGVRQGCSLAPFLFAVGFHKELRDALHAVKTQHGEDAPVGIAAILDNANLWGRPDLVAQLTRDLVERINARGDVQLKPAADEIIWLSDDSLPSPLETLATQRHARVVRPDSSTRVLGCIVGGGALVHETAKLFTEDHEQLIRCLQSEHMPLQMAQLLIRVVHVPSAVHLLRTTPPAQASLVIDQIDDQLDALLTRYGIHCVSDAEREAVHQAALRVGDGGLGFVTALDTAPLAFWANFAQSASQLVRADHRHLLESPWIQNALKDCFDSDQFVPVRRAAIEAAKPLTPSTADPLDVAAFYQEATVPRHRRAERVALGLPRPPAQQLQKSLRRIQEAKLLKLFVGDLPHGHPKIKRLDACRGATGSAWLTCLPKNNFTTFRDYDFRVAVRLRLGLIPVELETPNCTACGYGPSFADAPSHLISCTRTMHSNGAATTGHNLVGSALTYYLTAGGLAVNPEVTNLSEHGGFRPDLMILDAFQQRFLTDHTIINPLSWSRRDLTVEQSLDAAALTKERSYSRMAADMGAKFVPIVFSALGHCPSTAMDFLRFQTFKPLESRVATYPGGENGLIHDMIAAVSCAVQKRNGIVAQMAVKRMSRLAQPAFAVGIP